MAGKTGYACLYLLTLLPLAAQKKPWVEPKMNALQIAVDPGPGIWENKPMPVDIPVIFKHTVLGDGRRSATIGKPPWTLDIVFSAEAWTYKQARDQKHHAAVYQGEVMKDLATGKFRLVLSKGLTYAADKSGR